MTKITVKSKTVYENEEIEVPSMGALVAVESVGKHRVRIIWVEEAK